MVRVGMEMELKRKWRAWGFKYALVGWGDFTPHHPLDY
jgi:hypothetical protein